MKVFFFDVKYVISYLFKNIVLFHLEEVLFINFIVYFIPIRINISDYYSVLLDIKKFFISFFFKQSKHFK